MKNHNAVYFLAGMFAGAVAALLIALLAVGLPRPRPVTVPVIAKTISGAVQEAVTKKVQVSPRALGSEWLVQEEVVCGDKLPPVPERWAFDGTCEALNRYRADAILTRISGGSDQVGKHLYQCDCHEYQFPYGVDWTIQWEAK